MCSLESAHCILAGKIIDCGNLEDPENGEVFQSGSTVGATANYICYGGYLVVSGDVVRTCQNNEQWSGVAVICVGKSAL